MSYQLFDQGLTADAIREIKQVRGREDRAVEQLKRWKESEHVLNLLRGIKASEGVLTGMEMSLWQKATRRR